MVEKRRPDISFLAKEALSKKSEIVLSEEFAQRVNSLAGVLPNSTELATLFAPWDGQVASKAVREGRKYSAPSLEWTNFMETLVDKEGKKEFIHLKKLVRTAYSFFNIRTLGQFRDFTSDTDRITQRIGERGRAFGYLAFRKINQISISE